MRLLVFGGWGQLGTDLASAAEGRHQLVRPARTDADVTDLDAVRRVVAEAGPNAVVDAAAFHKVEVCEQDPATTFAVNAVGALNVARAARESGARCVYVSSDYVFDGTNPHGYVEDHPVSPLSVYGVAKAAGERAVLNASPQGLVVRMSGVFGHAGSSGKGGNFVETMLAKGERGEPLAVVDDLVFAPTCAHDAAERILLLVERDAPPGIYHAANAGSCSWFAFARAIFELSGLDPVLTPKASGSQEVRRPPFSILLDTRSAVLGLPPNRHWRDALAWYLDARRDRGSATPAS
jgi:dTDP-4-dehydrorhamnose reductase